MRSGEGKGWLPANNRRVPRLTFIGVDIIAGNDPGATQPGQTGRDIGACRVIGIEAGGVVDNDWRLAGGGADGNFPHRDADLGMTEAVHINLAGSRQRAGGDAGRGGDSFGGWHLDAPRMMVREIRYAPSGGSSSRRSKLPETSNRADLPYASVNWIRFEGSSCRDRNRQ